VNAIQCAAIAVLFAIAPALAQEASPPQPKPSGELEVHVVVTPDPDIGKKWISSAPSPGFTIARTNRIPERGTAHIAFLVTGHKVSESGHPDITIDVVIRKPDGTVLSATRDYAKVVYHTGEGGFVMADPTLHIRFDSSDPPGEWVVEAFAKDRLAASKSYARGAFVLGGNG
jgi:hypothetical protein